MEGEQRSERDFPHYVSACPCCGPTGRRAAMFWGWAVLAIGAAWLLSNLEVIPEDWWSVVIPILLIGWGITNLWTARKSGEPK